MSTRFNPQKIDQSALKTTPTETDFKPSMQPPNPQKNLFRSYSNQPNHSNQPNQLNQPNQPNQLNQPNQAPRDTPLNNQKPQHKEMPQVFQTPNQPLQGVNPLVQQNSKNPQNSNTPNQPPEKKGSSKSGISYVLPHEWAFWLVIVTTRHNSNRSYQIEEIFRFENAEYFYKYFKKLPLFSSLRNVNNKRISLSLFKERIKPAWEDKKNQGGFCYSFQVGVSHVDDVWERVLHMAIGETLKMNTLPESEEINGVILTLKKDVPTNIYELQIWTGCKEKDQNNMTQKEHRDKQAAYGNEISCDFATFNTEKEFAVKYQNVKAIPTSI